MAMRAHEKLRFWRRVRDLSQSALGEKLGCGQKWILVLERGYQMNDETRKKLAEILDIPVEALTDEAPDPQIIIFPEEPVAHE